MAIPMLKIRRSLGRLIFNMGIATPGKTVFLIETAPRYQLDAPQAVWNKDQVQDILHQCSQELIELPGIPWKPMNPLRTEFFSRTINMYLQFSSFSMLIWRRYLKSFVMEDKKLFIWRSQYRGCWWSGDARSQGTSNHDIDLVKPR